MSIAKFMCGVAAVVASAGASAFIAAHAEDAVKIGLILPMTGGQASTGKQIDNAIKLYMQQHADTVAGKKIEVILKDDAAVPDNTKRLARETKDALLRGEIRLMGELLNESWNYKKKFTSKISNDRIDQIYDTARAHGAVGGKISGAGGGGFMFFICEYDRKHLVANELGKLGVEIVQYNFDKDGLQTWRYSDGPAH